MIKLIPLAVVSALLMGCAARRPALPHDREAIHAELRQIAVEEAKDKPPKSTSFPLWRWFLD